MEREDEKEREREGKKEKGKERERERESPRIKKNNKHLYSGKSMKNSCERERKGWE